jgi:DNA-binding NtrC family response regulator
MSKKKILLLDDEKNMTFIVKSMLEKDGFSVKEFNDPKEALQYFESHSDEFGVLITDLYMPQMNGMDVLTQVKKQHTDLPVIIVTAFGTVETAVNALKKGAFDYVTKPFDQAELLNVVHKAFNTFSLSTLEPSAPMMPGGQILQSMIHFGDSAEMVELRRLIQKIAPSPSTVLVTGESGTGKELVATAIHKLSDRAAKPLIKINCAAIPNNLIESELFGYEKGAFTGATNSKPGRFELANEGTIFLDEVADMPLEMQVKLLRVIQESEFERVGGLNTIRVNVRLIAATNKDLPREVQEGRFREDLYYRLNVVPIHLPPLRQRKADIENLIVFFINKFNEKLNKKITRPKSDCLKKLKEYYWPGNIRQLENVIEHAVLMSEGDELRVCDLPKDLLALVSDAESAMSEEDNNDDPIAALEGGESFKEIVKRQTQAVERELITKSLSDNDGNISKTAEDLGLSRKGLQLKLKELQIRYTVE